MEDDKATPAVELRCSKIENQIDEAPVEDLEPGSWAVAMFWDGKKRVGRSFPINRYFLGVIYLYQRIIQAIFFYIWFTL